MVDGPPATAPGQVSPTVPFERARLWRMVDEIRGYLAELRHIDAFMQHVNELGSFDTPYPGWPRGKTLDVDPGLHWRPSFGVMTITLGRTFPFDVDVRYMEPVTAEDIEALSARLWEHAQRWADDNVTYLSHYVISRITYPDEARYDEIRNYLYAVADRLSWFQGSDFGKLGDDLGGWKGEAAENFHDEFYSRIKGVAHHQEWLVTRLLAAAAVFKGTIRYSQHALMNAVTYTWELLREQLRLRRDARRGTELTGTELTRVFLTVAGAAASMLASFFSNGLSAAFSLALVGEAFAATAAMLPDNAPSREIKGSTAVELWKQLTESIGEIERFASDEFDDLHNQLRQVVKAMDGGEVVIAVKRPLLADGASGETFHHLTSSRYLGMVR